MLSHYSRLKNVDFYQVDNSSSIFFAYRPKRVFDTHCISIIGRSESVKVSPSGNKIAYSSFDLNEVIIFDYVVDYEGIQIQRNMRFGTGLNSPHGLAWINEHTIVVANRDGPAVVFNVSDNACNYIIDIKEMSKSNDVTVSVSPQNIRLYFCKTNNRIDYCDLNNNWNASFCGSLNTLVDLQVPDGIALSPSGKILAITSALDNRIVIYNIENQTHHTLGNTDRPHSVCFVTDELILTTGGNDPCVVCWNMSDNHLACKLRILNKRQFSLRYNDTEGGVKGICSCPRNRIIFLTCPNAPFLAVDARIFYTLIGS